MSNDTWLEGNLTTLDDNPWSNLNVPYTVAEFLVAIAAIIGNLLVIVVYLKERRLRKRTKYYIISLAIADLLVGFFGIPFAVLASVGLPRNIYLCLFNMSLLIVLCTISIYCLVAVSVDRYWAILYPMSYSRNVRSKTAIEIIIICWLTGALVGFLPLFGWNEGGSSNRKCFFVEVMNYNYLVFLYFSTIIAPAVLLAGFYAHIYRVVLQQVHHRSLVRQMVMVSPGASSPTKNTGGMLKLLGAARKKEVKATQNLSIIVLFFIICWFPLYTINFVKAVCRDCDVSPTLTNSCIILSHLNSSFNPFLYAYHLKDFRVALHNLIFRSNDKSQKSSFLQRHRPQSELRTYCTTQGPTSSLYLYNDDKKPDERKWHLQSHLWTITNYKYPVEHYKPPDTGLKYLNPSGTDNLPTVIDALPVLKPRASSPSRLLPRFRSRSMCTFQMGGGDDGNSRFENKSRRFRHRTTVKSVGWSPSSCNDLSLSNSSDGGTTTRL